ncbi:MAG: HAMP domain-containing histidine kinase [Chloroflexi bacterium]|nr:HAMP domain-containing histidine kinase [Chloroflexota bacterium]
MGGRDRIRIGRCVGNDLGQRVAILKIMETNNSTSIRRKPYFLYLLLVSLLGVSLIVWSLAQTPSYETILYFVLLLALAIAGQTVATSATISQKAGVTYQITPAIALASIPFFGPSAAILIDAVAALSLWFIKAPEKAAWKKSGPQLAFNTGMNAIAMYLAGLVFVAMRTWLGAETIAGETIPWLVAAVVNDQVNLWLLVGILYLQHGRKMSPFAIWRQNLWAVPISILLMTFGGGLLAFSGRQFGWIGFVVFFLPILFSAYAFRLYIRKAQAHMDMLEQMVEERTAELAASNKRKDLLITVLTHDMITPLTSTQLYVELIKSNPQIALENPDLVDIMLHSQSTLLNLVKNILDIERLQLDGSLPLQKEDFDLTQLIAYTAGMVRALAKEKDVALNYHSKTELMTIHADRQQIGRVLLNLLTNAVKYTPAGGEINATSQIANGHAVITVRDTGYGIPADQLSSVFNRFSEAVQNKEKATGTGLGLAISKALIENHEGQITVHSVEGQGSAFTIKIPTK